MYAKNNTRIDGYGRPKYDVVSTNTSSTNTSNKPKCPAKITNIKEVQQYLIYKGFSCGKDGADGIYGTNTKKALTQYQLKEGGSKTIKKGSKSELAKVVQMFLICKKYSVGSYGADGEIGSASISAIKKFQKNNGLVQDGIVGINTWKYLLK